MGDSAAEDGCVGVLVLLGEDVAVVVAIVLTVRGRTGVVALGVGALVWRASRDNAEACCTCCVTFLLNCGVRSDMTSSSLPNSSASASWYWCGVAGGLSTTDILDEDCDWDGNLPWDGLCDCVGVGRGVAFWLVCELIVGAFWLGFGAAGGCVVEGTEVRYVSPGNCGRGIGV